MKQLKPQIIELLENAKQNELDFDAISTSLLQSIASWFNEFASQSWVSDTCSESAIEISSVLAYEAGELPDPQSDPTDQSS